MKIGWFIIVVLVGTWVYMKSNDSFSVEQKKLEKEVVEASFLDFSKQDEVIKELKDKKQYEMIQEIPKDEIGKELLFEEFEESFYKNIKQ